MTEANGPLIGVMNLRQISTLRPEGCCVGLLEDIRKIYVAARQIFHGVLGQRFIDPATLEKMLWSLDRQIEAGHDLLLQMVECGASWSTQRELSHLIEFFEVVRSEVVVRLGAGPHPHGAMKQ